MAQDFSRTLEQGGQSGFYRSRQWFARVHLDLPLLLLLLILSVSGLFILYSSSGGDLELVRKQAGHFSIGLIVLLITAQLPPRFYSSIAPWFYFVCLLSLLGVLLFGVGAKGAQRWLDLPGLPRFQPSELMKMALPLAVAWYMSKRSIPPKLSDLFKASILIMTSGLAVMFFAGMSWRLIISLLGLAAAAAPMMWFFVMRDYQKTRVLTFLSPESDPLGSGWNIIQSKTAIGSGGLQGKGWLMGSQSQLEFLPEGHTDFIIAVLAEEFGFVGVLLLLSLYFLIILRCLYLATHCETLFGRLVSASLLAAFFIYIFVNIGMVSGILPIVGVPLPLISYGGTSVISLLTAFGILMSMCTHKRT